MNKHATTLGYAGLIPFFALPVAMAADHIALFEGLLFFNQYSAIILSFFGGIHWYQALHDPNRTPQLYVAMLPSIWAWLVLIALPPAATVWALAAGIACIYFYDLKTLGMDEEYRRLRSRLTMLALLAHAAALWVYYQTGMR